MEKIGLRKAIYMVNLWKTVINTSIFPKPK